MLQRVGTRHRICSTATSIVRRRRSNACTRLLSISNSAASVLASSKRLTETTLDTAPWHDMQPTVKYHASQLFSTCSTHTHSLLKSIPQHCCTPFRAQRNRNGGARRSMVLVRAEGGPASQQDDETSRREEARIAALEKLTRSGPEQKKRQQTAVQRAERRATTPAASEKWREGQLFPQGWDRMSVPEKAWQLWAGERGFLFWSNKLALGAIATLAVAWILFRFVGPALGLYTLTNDLLSPPNE